MEPGTLASEAVFPSFRQDDSSYIGNREIFVYNCDCSILGVIVSDLRVLLRAILRGFCREFG